MRRPCMMALGGWATSRARSASILAVGGFAALAGVLWAQATTQQAAPGTPSLSAQQAADAMKLTDKQKQDIASIFQERKAARDRLLREADQATEKKKLDREELQNKIKQLEQQIEKLGDDGASTMATQDRDRAAFDETRRKIESSLSPEQRAQWNRSLNPTEDVLVNSMGIKLKRIPAGSFMMGRAKGKPNEKPQHKVTLTKPFYMGVYEVTQAQFKEIMGFNPSNFQGDTYPGWAKKKIDMGYRDEYRPVENVTWYQAKEFCLKLSDREGIWYRLPSEAEWEYVCRAGTTTEHHYGDKYDPAYSHFDKATREKFKDSIHGAGICQTAEIGMRKPSPWGLYDMYGNAMEWCEDVFLMYRPGDQVDPPPANGDDVRAHGPLADWENWAISANSRVMRGGTWNDWAWGSATREPNLAKNGGPSCGFRIVRAIQ